jgi:Uma2 family endonuclease
MSPQTLQPPASRRATLDDLMKVDGKAELIGGRIVHYMPVGYGPNRIAGRIYRSLDDYAEARGTGSAFTDSIGFAVPELPSGRESFSPDASYHDGPPPANEMDFVPGPPTFAVEVRSKNDHGKSAEAEMAAKRADYFQAGTQVVWDVDPQAECVRVYRAAEPDRPDIFHKGEQADAEPALPGWRLPVDRIFA